MKYLADLHIHSPYSRATSKQLVPENLECWAKIKGIDVIGTGDCIHPEWLEELKEKLEPKGNGFFQLKKGWRREPEGISNPDILGSEISYVLTTEISNIYKKNGKARKVHHLICFPDFESVDKFQERLDKIGNIRSDGRPILGLDAKDLLEISLECSEKVLFIPAHIWTPWFSVLGSKSGFDSIDECYEDLTPHIFALETGLSSDPPMNWLCSFLDKFKLVSNSDAHSLDKLGREANLFDTVCSYDAMYEALKTGDGFLGTVEFYPQEGKYHYDGHRACRVFWDPIKTNEHKGICSVCKKPVTKGVMYRVNELADRSSDEIPVQKQKFYSTTPLVELLGEINGTSSKSKKVQKTYYEALNKYGAEFHILLNSDLQVIKDNGDDVLAEGLKRLRAGQVKLTEGYDGVFGEVRVFS